MAIPPPVNADASGALGLDRLIVDVAIEEIVSSACGGLQYGKHLFDGVGGVGVLEDSGTEPRTNGYGSN